jgi:hypothetical protein
MKKKNPTFSRQASGSQFERHVREGDPAMEEIPLREESIYGYIVHRNPAYSSGLTPGDGAGFGEMTSGTPRHNAGQDSEGARYARPYGHETVKAKNPGKGKKNPSFTYPPHSSPENPGDGAGYGRSQSGAPSYAPGQSSTRNPSGKKHVDESVLFAKLAGKSPASDFKTLAEEQIRMAGQSGKGDKPSPKLRKSAETKARKAYKSAQKKKNPDRTDMRSGACPSCAANVVVPVGQSSGSCGGCGESLVVG